MIEKLLSIIIIILSTVYCTSRTSSGGIVADVAQSAGNVVAQVAHGNSASEVSMAELEYFILGSLKTFGSIQLMSLIGTIPANLVSAVCIQSMVPAVKRFCSTIKKFIIHYDPKSIYIKPEYLSRKRIDLESHGSFTDIKFLRLLDKYGYDHAVYSFYSNLPVSISLELLNKLSGDTRSSSRLIEELIKVIGILVDSDTDEMIKRASRVKNWGFLERLLHQPFLDVSKNSNMLLKIAVQDDQQEIISLVLNHSSFRIMTDGFSVIDWVAENNVLDVLSSLLDRKYFRASFNSDLVGKKLLLAYKNSNTAREKQIYEEAIDHLLGYASFDPTDLVYFIIRNDLYAFLPEFIGHSNMNIHESDPLIITLKHTLAKVDSYSKEQISIGLAIWAYKTNRIKDLDSIMKEQKTNHEYLNNLLVKVDIFRLMFEVIQVWS